MIRLLAAAVALLFCASSAGAAGVAIIKSVQGTVTIKRAESIIVAEPSNNLEAGDILMTAADGHVGIIFHDGSVLSLRENSYLRVVDFDFKPIENIFKFHLKLDKGAALFESGKIGTLAPESFKFDVPEGTIGIRGTKFLVEVR